MDYGKLWLTIVLALVFFTCLIVGGCVFVGWIGLRTVNHEIHNVEQRVRSVADEMKAENERKEQLLKDHEEGRITQEELKKQWEKK